MSNGLQQGDARNLDRMLREAHRAHHPGVAVDEPFLTASITSPPYGPLIDYGVNGQIGFGQTKQSYLSDCQAVFETLFNWTRDDGALWLVVDSYLDGSPHSNGVSGLNVLPFTMAGLAEQVGWTLREVIVWHKDRTRPWTHHGKLRNAFEYVLLLVKTKDFKFQVHRLRDNQDLARWWVRYPERYNVFGKVPDNVWHVPIPTQGSWARKSYAHACPLPPELVRRMVLLSSDEDDYVCDPFAGIGTVPGVAEALGRRPVAFELNPEFVKHYDNHVRDEIRTNVLAASGDDVTGGPSAETVSTLRILKFPKVLLSKARSQPEVGLLPHCVIVDVESVEPLDVKGSTVGQATWYFVVPDGRVSEQEHLQTLLKDFARRAPASKFGVSGDVRVVGEREAKRVLKGREWAVYEHGRTWQTSLVVDGIKTLHIPVSDKRGLYPPVASNRRLDINLDFVGDSRSADPNR